MAVPLMTEGLGLFVNNKILAATDSGIANNMGRSAENCVFYNKMG